jgi:S-adenosylmethionine:tRNA ribosyltransferase-isomerase
MTTAPWFQVPDHREAARTPESRGLARDEVRMLVATPGALAHRRARDLADEIRPGDLLVVNSSATVPAAVVLSGARAGQLVHVSTQRDDGCWLVEVRRRDNTGPASDVTVGEVLRLPGGLRLRVAGAHPTGQTRLWTTRPVPWIDRVRYLDAHGRPIQYPYVAEPLALADLQNVYAVEPGSAEMPSAGRPLTGPLLSRLVGRGAVLTSVVLHTGVSSQQASEPPQPEPFTVPDVAARLVNETRRVGRRVVAVGTTVVRALESAADRSGRVHAATGWTDLVLGADRPARAVDGILTGLHDPGASHLDLLAAVVGRQLVEDAYAEVLTQDYLWHELGDTMLLLNETERGPGAR